MDRPKKQGLRMTKKNYPINFFMGLEARLLDEIGVASSMELTVLSAIRCISLDEASAAAIGASYKEIKLSIDCSHENLSKSLKALEGNGMLLRRQDTNDRRVIRYQLTEPAWKLIGSADNFISQEIMRYVVDGLYPG